MFPLDFPLGVLGPRAAKGQLVLDPFSGRGTTNYAARLLGLPSIGIDSSPVAAALTEAKLVNTTPDEINEAARTVLEDKDTSVGIPTGEFWRTAFHPDVLEAICRLRNNLLSDCSTPARKGLRAVVMGALHGPRTKKAPASYLSNQCTRTYAPKPRYAVAYWRRHHLQAPKVDVLDVIARRARRYFAGQPPAIGVAITGDSREAATFLSLAGQQVRWIVTSPPYYGMRTYIPDQWLRHWFVGGPSDVDYSTAAQLAHGDPQTFARQLRTVWSNVATIARSDARLVIRYGGIADRQADPVSILKESLHGSPWVLTTICDAGSASVGRRQALHFAGKTNAPRAEHDAWARLRD